MVLGVDLFFSLFNNLAIFIALVGVYGYLIVQLKPSTWYKRQFLLGLTFGLFAIGCMYAKIPVFEGVIVDQRNAIIALSGFFGGPLAAYLSAAFAGAFRLYLGGQGALAGVIGVTLAATSGVLLSRRNKPFGSVPRAATSAFLATLFILPGFLFVKDFQTGLTLLKSMSAPYGLAIFLGIFIVRYVTD
jgi:LytS/YehU family sensor histidine kinase